MALRPLHGAAMLACALALAAPSPASAQSTPPSCPDRTDQIPNAVSRERAIDAADWAKARLARQSGAIWWKRSGTQVAYGADLSMALLDLGGDYCVVVGKWIDWHLAHLNLVGDPPPPHDPRNEVDYNMHHGAVGAWSEDAGGTEQSLNPRGYDNRNAALLTVARIYQARATGGIAWFRSNQRLERLIEAAKYLDRLYADVTPTTGLTRLSTGDWDSNADNGAKFFQDNVTTWAGYRDFGQFLTKYDATELAPFGVTAATYIERAGMIRDGIEAHLYVGAPTHLYKLALSNNNNNAFPFTCWYKGGYTQLFGLWYGVWGPYSPLPESNARRGAFFTRFMKPDAQLGWAVRNTQESATDNCNWIDTDGIKSQPALAALKASTQESQYQGGPHHEASAIVWESNLPINRAPNATLDQQFADPFWDAWSLSGYIRYLTHVRVHAYQDNDPDTNGFFTSGTWGTETPAATDPIDGRTAIYSGKAPSVADVDVHGTFVGAKFAPKIPERGLYTVRLVYNRTSDRSEDVPVMIRHLDANDDPKTETVHVNQKLSMADGTTHLLEKPGVSSFCFKEGRHPAPDTGQWISVFNGSTIKNVSADAVVLQRVGSC